MKHEERWIDLTVTLHNDLVHWPGNPPIQIQTLQDMKQGDPKNLSAFSMGAHSGTHMDAPKHFMKDGISLDRLLLEVVVGAARVIEIQDPECIKSEELRRHHIPPRERILFKTKNSSRMWHKRKFLKDFVYLSKEAASELARIKV